MIGWQTKQAVRRLYGYRCGYCGLSEAHAGGELTIDHFQPQCRGGTDDIDNLVYACGPCNYYKGAQWNPGQPPVLHPLRDDIAAHFALAPRGLLRALTPQGARHIAALRLNRPTLLLRRRGIALPRKKRSTRRQ